ncbi:sulfurtransferase complex subunit TusD [Halioglobus maricola]|uniref:sulfurtransferase complex subunit TusD n=1 Tax=Halioglobus maricola TaxID=2601894 RepID=UPI00147887A3|nr:sulfurtransferase complex subunit TusD [Halioglobus maricola]
MIYTLLVTSSPASGSGARTACAFAQAAIAAGHEVNRVFFLDEGTSTGSATAVFPQDEADRLAPWVSLAEAHDIDLVLCISSAIKRGMLDTTEARRYERAATTVHPAFTVSGLGQLVDAGAGADRLLTFGG